MEKAKTKNCEIWIEGEILMMKLSGEIMPEEIEEVGRIGLDLAKKHKEVKYNIADISDVRSVPLSTRKVASEFSGPVKKIAFVCANPVARIIGSFFVRRYKIGPSLKLVSSVEEAKKWFREK